MWGPGRAPRGPWCEAGAPHPVEGLDCSILHGIFSPAPTALAYLRVSTAAMQCIALCLVVLALASAANADRYQLDGWTAERSKSYPTAAQHADRRSVFCQRESVSTLLTNDVRGHHLDQSGNVSILPALVNGRKTTRSLKERTITASEEGCETCTSLINSGGK